MHTVARKSRRGAHALSPPVLLAWAPRMRGGHSRKSPPFPALQAVSHPSKRFQLSYLVMPHMSTGARDFGGAHPLDYTEKTRTQVSETLDMNKGAGR